MATATLASAPTTVACVKDFATVLATMCSWPRVPSDYTDTSQWRSSAPSGLLQNKVPRVIKKNSVEKCLEMFAEIAEKKDSYRRGRRRCRLRRPLLRRHRSWEAF